MGSQQSSHANVETKDIAPSVVKQVHENGSKESVRGRKSQNNETSADLKETFEFVSVAESDETQPDTASESGDDDIVGSDEELEAGLEERRQILNDAKMLKNYALFHLHPEKSVETSDGCSFGRNYFSRPSAPEQVSFDEAEEHGNILQDVAELKKFATFHLHPEAPVTTTDETACGRNYFSRPSAIEQEDDEDAEERAAILAECAELKKYATYHLHPEAPVTNEGDGTGFGRNYFVRASAPEFETKEDAEERELILEEAKLLKKYAGFHLHPEAPVTTTDPNAFGRNYFVRPSADEHETPEEAEERASVLADCADLKKYAAYHLHPEAPVETTDSTVFGRNYFTRASAPEEEDVDDAEERAQVLAECAELKKYATYHLHPEAPVTNGGDGTAFGRNYFDRASAPEQETEEDAAERALVLEEAKLLKKYAEFHMHPEAPVIGSDPTSCGRNYFSRPSAPEQETPEEAEARDSIMADVAELKKYASYHLHPEAPVETTDDAACGRNYFSRASAPEQEDVDDAEERAMVLAECAELKMYASYHLHPEAPVTNGGDGTPFGRNYFDRASAIEQEAVEDAEERALILQEAKLLKKHAEFHMHPEAPVDTLDSNAYGRDYFSRPSAVEQETPEEAEERAQILADVAELKKFATYHLHPEAPVTMTDATAFGRNYFSRASAPEQEDIEDTEERARVLAECAELKKYASYHLHPEAPVANGGDGTGFGRNYYNRPSAAAQMSTEEMQDTAIVLDDASELKKYAEFHLHPEKPVDGDDPAARGRNFFTRPEASTNAAVYSTGENLMEDDSYGQHFSLDEELELRKSLNSVIKPLETFVPLASSDENTKQKEGGNLSRSPSDVMLFPGMTEDAY